MKVLKELGVAGSATYKEAADAALPVVPAAFV
jgi:hypothetical protein